MCDNISSLLQRTAINVVAVAQLQLRVLQCAAVFLLEKNPTIL